MAKEYDLLIVGGGMAGASLACALADSGMQIAILEAVPWQSDLQPSYDVRTISLSHGSRLIYETLGIWQQIDPQARCPINSIHISDRGHPGFTHLDRMDADKQALQPPRPLDLLTEKTAADGLPLEIRNSLEPNAHGIDMSTIPL